MPRYCISIPANGEIIVWVEAKSSNEAIKKVVANCDIPSRNPDVFYPDDGAVTNVEWADPAEWAIEKKS
jgi:hypothetical protein